MRIGGASFFVADDLLLARPVRPVLAYALRFRQQRSKQKTGKRKKENGKTKRRNTKLSVISKTKAKT